MGIKEIYEHSYKWFIIATACILILAIAQIGYQYYTTGDFITKSVTLLGGISLEIDTQYSDLEELRLYLNNKFPGEEFYVRTTKIAGQQKGLIVEGTDVSKDELCEAVKEKLGGQAPSLEDLSKNVKNVSARFSEGFFRTVVIAVLIAFVLMGIVVFYSFRILVPSLAVILCAFSDIVVTIAVFNTLGMRLTLGGVVAFLMLVGYCFHISSKISELAGEFKQFMAADMHLTAVDVPSVGAVHDLGDPFVVRQNVAADDARGDHLGSVAARQGGQSQRRPRRRPAADVGGGAGRRHRSPGLVGPVRRQPAVRPGDHGSAGGWCRGVRLLWRCPLDRGPRRSADTEEETG